jgi:hypothetical protein
MKIKQANWLFGRGARLGAEEKVIRCSNFENLCGDEKFMRHFRCYPMDQFSSNAKSPYSESHPFNLNQQTISHRNEKLFKFDNFSMYTVKRVEKLIASQL